MHYVYLLKSEKSDFIYIGSTYNMEKRLNEHNNGYVKATKEHTPFKLLYYEAYSDRLDAINREYKLKHYGSTIGHLKRRLKNSLMINDSQKGGVQFDHSKKKFIEDGFTEIENFRKSKSH